MIATLVVVASCAAAVVAFQLYQVSLEQQRRRLVDLAADRAHMISAIERFDAEFPEEDHTDGALSTTLQQHLGGQEAPPLGLGDTGEFTLGVRAGEDILVLVTQRYAGPEGPSRVPFQSGLAEPMRRALQGEIGTMDGRDYRGTMVMAAFRPVAGTAMGVVAKIDLDEVRAPFFRAALRGSGAVAVLVLTGVLVLLWLASPVGNEIANSRQVISWVVEESPLVFYKCVSDALGCEYQVSPQIERLVGFNPKEWAAIPLTQRIHPDDLERVTIEVDRAHEEGLRYSTTYRLVARDGGTVWITDHATVQKDPATGRLVVIGAMVDVDPLKSAEASLDEARGRYEAIVRAAGDGIVIVDDRGTIVESNHAANEIFGYSGQEMLAKPVTALMPEGLRAQQCESFAELQASGAPESHLRAEAVGMRRDGREVPVELTISSFARGDKVFSCGFIRDCTERKRGEAAMTRLAAAIEQIGEGVMITDPDGTIEFVNGAFEAISGYTAAEVVGKSPRILDSGRHDRAFFGEMWRTISGGDVWRGRMTNRRKDGSLYQEDQVISPMLDDAGRIVNYVSVKRDVTRDLILEDQIRRAQKLEVLGQLAGGIAHDFNNLLTGIGGYTELAHSSLQAESQAAADLGEVSGLVRRAADLTRRLLLFGRREARRDEIIDLGALVASSMKMLKVILGEQIASDVVAPLDAVSFRGDPGMLEQVLVNLVLNARDAMPLGGRLTIEVTSEVVADSVSGNLPVKPGSYAVLVVADDGCGMEPEVVERVFEPFFTTKATGKGTGLGLATSYSIVTDHGGMIAVDSRPGRGTTFRVYLPQALGDVEASGRDESVEPRPTVDTGKVLLVEDEDGVRAVVQRILAKHGCDVVTARDCEEARHIFAREGDSISLLLSDIRLPDGDGTTLYRQLTEQGAEFKALFVSGYHDLAADRDVLDRTGVGFLPKPFSESELMRGIREVLSG